MKHTTTLLRSVLLLCGLVVSAHPYSFSGDRMEQFTVALGVGGGYCNWGALQRHMGMGYYGTGRFFAFDDLFIDFRYAGFDEMHDLHRSRLESIGSSVGYFFPVNNPARPFVAVGITQLNHKGASRSYFSGEYDHYKIRGGNYFLETGLQLSLDKIFAASFSPFVSVATMEARTCWTAGVVAGIVILIGNR